MRTGKTKRRITLEMPSCQHFSSSAGTQACLPGVFDPIAIPIFLVQRFANSCSKTIPILLCSSWTATTNGLIESHWKTMFHMSRAYLTEKQMSRYFWFYWVVHSARMMNAIPEKSGGKLASPFLLVHGVGHDEHTWFPLFLVCYFHHVLDGDTSHSHTQPHTMDGITIGRSPTSNALLVYNPRSETYYEPDSYRLNPYRLLSLVYPQLSMTVDSSAP